MAKTLSTAVRVGVIVNPIAGMGGAVALHGTDGDASEQARALGALPGAEERMQRALAVLRREHPAAIDIVAAAGAMGENSVCASGLTVARTVGVASNTTSAADTRAAAIAMRDADVDLVLFAGGDGTAADIVAELGTVITVLGTPSGVKMHSGVFARTPERAGEIAAEYLAAGERRVSFETEVLDVAPGEHDISDIAVARVPHATAGVQGPKVARPDSSEADIPALGADIAASMTAGTSYILGPGTTVGSILGALGLEGTRNGCDIVANGALVTVDASEETLFEHVSTHPGSVLILGVVGGQGFLLGRGNQQISPRVLSLIDDENIVIVAAQNKIDALQPPQLHVDLGRAEPYLALQGYRRIRTSPTRSTVLRITH
ncbi:ATP-NAD kinase family protein [Salinibacterium sp. SWN1162]|uniref:ATP-NAD kinase family protein n=1 Tax=Salinibacterium sp. SWN1162 TaxID=2792053 RepID=UPI0018CD3114|nr:NAD(+)/NADH kinase [Salinibacterium sp. SWN1162]MBH0007855.1 NAD(+)/NADH kinase [Salinibacterium sp. SWN1162]